MYIYYLNETSESIKKLRPPKANRKTAQHSM
ncbi:hypothetical protein SNOG_11870 [Parastagonospora nodorum SN15]|uniref:Uncharacterized protein n=1 Tax=Phaeosphaeria nodorum (strain SN15 / ATCC MYA-4574 / FGSC 10173) TaxID=321614 RepID=Q0U8P4_PHANO|nr:hypothetical protein SNOG_11870 [Parastagonospora nodorum SN15]EAT80914.1 hypothetical protein SNOG_11870 [Parastagonospora nodorum SN15]